MSQGESGGVPAGSGGSADARDRVEDPDAALDTPNCVVCLHRMEAAETATGLPYWHCDHCGASRVV